MIVYGQPGQFASVLVSQGVLDSPIRVENAGLLWLDRHDVRRVGIGAIGPAGTAELSVQLPASPSLAGLTLYLQAVLDQPTHLSSNWLPVAIVP